MRVVESDCGSYVATRERHAGPSRQVFLEVDLEVEEQDDKLRVPREDFAEVRECHIDQGRPRALDRRQRVFEDRVQLRAEPFELTRDADARSPQPVRVDELRVVDRQRRACLA